MNELITTSPIEIDVCLCGFCGQCMNADDNFCRHCGEDCRGLIVEPASTQLSGRSNGRSTEVGAVRLPGDLQKIVDNRLVVTGLVAFAGPLGLLALWFSQRIRKRTKIIVTTSYILLTVVLPIAVAWYWLDVSLRPIVELLNK